MNSYDESNGAAKPPVPRIGVFFDHPSRQYAPGEELVVRYDVEGVELPAIQAMERAVVWYTEGKGEEDLGVHRFDRIDDVAGLAEALPDGTIATRLPASPLSYEGVIVKIRWCVRIRLFFVVGRDFVSEHVFEIGAIAPARGVVERVQ